MALTLALARMATARRRTTIPTVVPMPLVPVMPVVLARAMQKGKTLTAMVLLPAQEAQSAVVLETAMTALW